MRASPSVAALVRREVASARTGRGQGDVAAAQRRIHGVRLGALGMNAARSELKDLQAQLLGAGPALARVWEDQAVTDVLINSSTSVWVDRGAGMQRASCDVGDVRALAVRLASLAGQRLDDAVPITDGRLPDGTRLHAVLAPVAADGACISLRRHRLHALGLADWRSGGGLGDHGERVLRALVRRRANLLISGGTGSGKTTLLAALLALVPTDERIVCLEEARELDPQHPHVVCLQSRAANVQGAGAVTLTELVRAAMRMRPDRLVLGECRGAEVREVLLALNTGHDGGMATVHANAATDVPARLVALGSLAGLSAEAVAVQAASAFDALVHLTRVGSRRVVSQVATMTLDSGVLRADLALLWDGSDLVPADAWPALADRLDGPQR